MRSLLLLLFFVPISTFAQKACYSSLKQDMLTIGNALIERKFLWNKGNLITFCLTDKSSGQTWLNKGNSSDFVISKVNSPASNASYASREVRESPIHPAYLEITVTFSLKALQIRRVFRIYNNSPTLACDTWLKGKLEANSNSAEEHLADKKNIESNKNLETNSDAVVLDQIKLDGFHWRTKLVEFLDVSDWNNNLVFESNIIPYRKNSYKGNIAFAHNQENNRGIFFLKEAPSSATQLAYAGSDFTTEFGHFVVTGLGLSHDDIKESEWRKAYGCVTGVYSGSEVNGLLALRNYQKKLRKLLPERDEIVMMNTWGDRSQDSKVNEKFSLAEVEKAAQLGVSHFQIDDGWQSGKSPNSAVAKGSFKNIWDNPDYWKPDPQKYPNGLHPIVKKGKELGVEVCLWFNPSIQNNYADWEKDFQAIITLYEEYGIRTFKIDGLSIPTKESEVNLRRLFDKVLEKTKNNVVFNLDCTAGRRSGYHMFNEYGNIFLENRYTDWQNYYPYWTLRNLWQLSKYVPAEKLQIEFLNKWRNAEKYGNDPFAPAKYSFDYLFAITMAAQPLCWFEASGLPQEAFGTAKLIKAYRQVQHDFHSGTILPIGDEPSGRSWTGFQSIKENEGYFIFFREDNPTNTALIKTWLPEAVKVQLEPVLGNAKPMIQTTGANGTLNIEMKGINDFAMYRYKTSK